MNIMLSLFHWILDAGFRASLLSIAILLLQAALRPVISARARYLLWLPVLLVLSVPILPRSRWSAENLFTPAAAPVLAPAIGQDIGDAPHASRGASVSSTDWKQSIAAIIWAAGVVLSLAGGLALYCVTLRRFIQIAERPDVSLTMLLASLSAELRLRHPPRVILSSAVESPAITGMLRPLLLLPAGFGTSFTASEARLVLKHELMHLKRLDLPINALVFLLNTLHWFNPILWLASWYARQQREAACDAQVLASETTDSRGDYGNVLLKAESVRYAPWLSIGFVGIFEPGRVLHSRIKAIARYRRPGPLSAIVAAIAILCLAILGATHAQTSQPAQAGAGAVVTVPGLPDANPGGLITREYRLASSFAPQIAGQTAMDYLTAHGVQFPSGANALYFQASSRLIVHDTAANLDLVDALTKNFLASPANPAASAPPAPAFVPGSIEDKLNSIIIPKIDFRDATTREAIDYLRQQSIQLDTAEADPSRRGVKITIASDIPRGQRITLSLTNIPLIHALMYICQLGGGKLTVNADGVAIAAP